MGSNTSSLERIAKPDTTRLCSITQGRMRLQDSRQQAVPADCRCCRACSYSGKYTAMAGTQTARDKSVPLQSCAGPSVRAILMRPSNAFLQIQSGGSDTRPPHVTCLLCDVLTGGQARCIWLALATPSYAACSSCNAIETQRRSSLRELKT